MRVLKVRSKVVACPVCGRESLTGTTFDLPEEEIEYTPQFLPRPKSRGGPEGDYLVDNLTLFNNYLCPRDLYAYTGNVTVREDGPRFDENVFYDFRRRVRADSRDHIGARIRFFIQALVHNGLPPAAMVPADLPAKRCAAVAARIGALVREAMRDETPPRALAATFEALDAEDGANPFRPLVADFHASAPVMRSFLELQLADLLFLMRRAGDRGAVPVPYGMLREVLDRTARHFARAPALNTDLAADLLFQCVRMIDFFDDDRADALRAAAHAASAFLVGLQLRVGADLGHRLDAPARNADVLFLLHLTLSREMGGPAEGESALLRLLERRLGILQDYAYPGDSAESVRTARIGRNLSRLRREFIHRHAVADADPR
jgi:hypothetical protein